MSSRPKPQRAPPLITTLFHLIPSIQSDPYESNFQLPISARFHNQTSFKNQPPIMTHSKNKSRPEGPLSIKQSFKERFNSSNPLQQRTELIAVFQPDFFTCSPPPPAEANSLSIWECKGSLTRHSLQQSAHYFFTITSTSGDSVTLVNQFSRGPQK